MNIASNTAQELCELLADIRPILRESNKITLMNEAARLHSMILPELRKEIEQESASYCSKYCVRGGGTKKEEYERSIELFEQIYKEKGLYLALALLADSQYGNDDLFAIMEILKPGKGRVRDILNKDNK